MIALFNEILFRPIFNILVAVYNTAAFQDFGLAVVIVTIMVRLILSPLSIKAIRSQRSLAVLQPKIKEIQEKFKNNREEIGRATMELYKANGVNPFSGCLPLLVQIPVLLALYQAFQAVFQPNSLSSLYSFITNPGAINQVSLGFIQLSQSNPVLAIVAGVLQFLQSRQASKMQSTGQNDQMASMNKQMLYLFPLIVIIISWKLQVGIVLYWITTTLFSIVEQLYISRKYDVR